MTRTLRLSILGWVGGMNDTNLALLCDFCFLIVAAAIAAAVIAALVAAVKCIRVCLSHHSHAVASKQDRVFEQVPSA